MIHGCFFEKLGLAPERSPVDQPCAVPKEKTCYQKNFLDLLQVDEKSPNSPLISNKKQ